MRRPLKAWLLFFIFSLCAAAVLLTHYVRQQRPAPAPRELFAVVNEQLAALRADDYLGAYRHAATGVQQKFTVAQFEKMIRERYRHMPHADRVEFGTVKVQDATSAFVQVFFFERDGAVRSFIYSLVHEEAGWRIDGVEEVSPGGTHGPPAGRPV